MDYSFHALPPPEFTTDALLEGRVTLKQPRRGYRVTVDSLLLADFATTARTAALAIDLGAGVGALGLVLAAVGGARAVALIEAEPELVALARENLVRAGGRGTVHACDLARQRLPAELLQHAELVVCNPPFFPSARGTPARENARRARSGELEPFVRAARALLSGPRARAAFCYPAGELAHLLSTAEDAKLVPKRLRFVHARSDNPARLALIELRLAKPGGLVVLPPLVEWNGRARTDELSRIVAGRFGALR
jgi:tRNA1Val (adenine37-N6)-methyltransferase